MVITATEAKNCFGQLLEEVQRGPVAASQPAAPAVEERPSMPPEAIAFYEQYKDWVDMQNEHVERYGVFGEEYRVW